MKKMRKLSLFIILLGLLEPVSLRAQHVEPIAFGDFEHWVTREIKESALLGGKRRLYTPSLRHSISKGIKRIGTWAVLPGRRRM